MTQKKSPSFEKRPKMEPRCPFCLNPENNHKPSCIYFLGTIQDGQLVTENLDRKETDVFSNFGGRDGDED